MQTAFSVHRIRLHSGCWQHWRIPDSFQKKQACWRSATVIHSTVNTMHHRSASSIFRLRRWQRSAVIICTGICIHPLLKRRPVTLRRSFTQERRQNENKIINYQKKQSCMRLFFCAKKCEDTMYLIGIFPLLRLVVGSRREERMSGQNAPTAAGDGMGNSMKTVKNER